MAWTSMTWHQAVRLSVSTVAFAVAACGSTVSLKEMKGDLPEREKTRLMRAAEIGDLALVQLAVAQGENVNAKDGKLWTPLHYGASSGSGELVSYLLQEGADAVAPTAEMLTALHIAVMQDSRPVARTLPNHGTNPAVHSVSVDGARVVRGGV